MSFGQSFICATCKKEPPGDYHRYTCDIAGIDMEFYTCKGECDKKFRDKYIDPFKDESINTRFEIMAKEYSRPAFPDADIDFSSMDNGFNDVMNELGKALSIPAKILEGKGATMKYKVGDKVCIRKEDQYHSSDARVRLEACNYIPTIKRVINDHGHYEMEEYGLICHDKNIIGLYKEPEPIDNRFEILDL